MKVLITGVGGFVGSHLLKTVLEQTDWDVIGLDSYRHHGKLDRVQYQMEGLDRSRYTHLVYDLTIPFSDQFARHLEDVDYVVSIASESHVERSITDPRPFVENNVSLMLTLLEWARTNHNIKVFYHMSTDEVYGPIISKSGHKEGARHRPSNPYSASKTMQESLCYAYWRTYGVPVVISNTLNIFGETQDVEKYIPKIIRSFVNDEVLHIHAGARGQIGTRFYMHAQNQCDAILFLLRRTPARFPANDLDRYNVVTDVELNNLEVAEAVAEIIGKPLIFEFEDFHISRPGHDLRYGLNGDKLAQLGWKPPLGFHESLERTVNWTLNHPEWLL